MCRSSIISGFHHPATRHIYIFLMCTTRHRSTILSFTHPAKHLIFMCTTRPSHAHTRNHTHTEVPGTTYLVYRSTIHVKFFIIPPQYISLVCHTSQEYHIIFLSSRHISYLYMCTTRSSQTHIHTGTTHTWDNLSTHAESGFVYAFECGRRRHRHRHRHRLLFRCCCRRRRPCPRPCLPRHCYCRCSFPVRHLASKGRTTASNGSHSGSRGNNNSGAGAGSGGGPVL